MAEENKGPEEEYIQSVVERFNKNKDDETLSDAEKLLMNKVLETQTRMTETRASLNKLNTDMQNLSTLLTTLDGKVQGFFDVIVGMKGS